MNCRNGLRVWNGGRCDHCVDIQQAVIESRAGMCASLVEGSLLLGVWISRMLLLCAKATVSTRGWWKGLESAST